MMKVTRRQLRRLIEGSIKRRGDYVIPAEDPIGDPLEDLDYSDDQKTKIKMLAMSDDEETQAQADLFADIGGHENIDRFGADTFSKQVQAGELGVDMLNDPDIDSALSKACDYWIYENKDYLSYFDNIDQDTFRDYADYMIDEHSPDPDGVTLIDVVKAYTVEVLDKRIKSLIDISNSAASVPSVDDSIAKYRSAKKLFSTEHDNPIVDDHVMFKFKSVLYKFYLDWKSYYETEQGYDMNNPDHIDRYKKNILTFKESKMRLTRRQLKNLIRENLLSEQFGSYMIGDTGNSPESYSEMSNCDKYNHQQARAAYWNQHGDNSKESDARREASRISNIMMMDDREAARECFRGQKWIDMVEDPEAYLTMWDIHKDIKEHWPTVKPKSAKEAAAAKSHQFKKEIEKRKLEQLIHAKSGTYKNGDALLLDISNSDSPELVLLELDESPPGLKVGEKFPKYTATIMYKGREYGVTFHIKEITLFEEGKGTQERRINILMDAWGPMGLGRQSNMTINKAMNEPLRVSHLLGPIKLCLDGGKFEGEVQPGEQHDLGIKMKDENLPLKYSVSHPGAYKYHAS